MGQTQSASTNTAGSATERSYGGKGYDTIYVLVRWSSHDLSGASVNFSTQQLEAVQTELQKIYPDCAIVLDAGKIEHYSVYTPPYNMEAEHHPPKPRIMVDAFVQRRKHGIQHEIYLVNQRFITPGAKQYSIHHTEEIIKAVLDPSDKFFIDCRRRGRSTYTGDADRIMEILLRV